MAEGWRKAIEERDSPTLKGIISASGFKPIVIEMARFELCFSAMNDSTAFLKKHGCGTLPEADTIKLSGVENTVKEAGTYVSSMKAVAVLVNKIIPAPSAKSRAAFKRELDLSIKDAPHKPIDETITWLAEAMGADSGQPAPSGSGGSKSSPKKFGRGGGGKGKSGGRGGGGKGSGGRGVVRGKP